MNIYKQKDFEKKKDWITQMAHFFGWDFSNENASIGHLQYQKDNLCLNIWTTKMTTLLQKGQWQKVRKDVKMDSIEKMLENPVNAFQIPKSNQPQYKRINH